MQSAEQGSSKKGTPGWAVALTFFMAMFAGLAIGAVAMKAFVAKRQKHDDFYQSALLRASDLVHVDWRCADGGICARVR